MNRRGRHSGENSVRLRTVSARGLGGGIGLDMPGPDALFNLVYLGVLKVERYVLMKLGDIVHANLALDYDGAMSKQIWRQDLMRTACGERGDRNWPRESHCYN